MANQANLDLVSRAYDSINQSFRTGNFDTLMQGLSTEDLLDHNPTPGQAPGLSGIRQFLASVGAAFSDYQVHIEDMVSDGDKVVARLVTTGTHDGAFWGMPPTGNKVRMDGIEIFRVENGMITERWGVFDVAALMMQIGAMPPPARA